MKKLRFYLVLKYVVVIFFVKGVYAQSNIFYPDKEIQVRTENACENDITKFTLSVVGSGFIFPQNSCNYEMATMTPAIHVIQGNYSGSEYYYTIDHEDNISSNYEFIHGFLEIKVEYSGCNGTATKYFYWDVADCNYYGPCGQVGDIVVKYNAGENEIYFFWGNSPDANSVWEVVTDETRRFIDYLPSNITPCPLIATPTGLSVSGNVREHPTITWNSNTEESLDGYNLYQSLNGATYSLLVTLSSQTTSFVDLGVIIGNSKFDPRACYKLSAFSSYDTESPLTLPVCIQYFGLSKKNNLSEENIHEKNKLIGAYPNPFNSSTNIKYKIGKEGQVKIKIYDILGNEVKTILNVYQQPGNYNVFFDSNNLSSGIYIYSLETNNYFESKTFTFVK